MVVTYLQPGSHVLCKYTQSDRSEVVDGEPRVFGIVLGENADQGGLQIRLLEPCCHLFDAHLLQHLLHQDLNEDST